VTPRVAVVIPVFDDAVRLRRCAEAVLDAASEVDGEVEVVVADNGSRDDPAAHLAGLPRVRLVREAAPGSYAARNRGVMETRAPLLAFTDADCVPRRAWLRAGLDALEGPPRADLVVGEIELFDDSADAGRGGDPVVRTYESVTAFRQRDYAERLRFGPTANLFVRRAAFDAAGGFDASLRSGGDKDFGQRATAAGYRLAFAPEALVGHPFRARRADLEAKVRRLVGGDLAAARGRPAGVAYVVARYLSKPLRTWAAIWRRRAGRPPHLNLAVAVLAVRVCAWQIDEALRLSRGGEPGR